MRHQKVEWWLLRAVGWRGGGMNVELLFNGDRALVWDDIKVPEMDSGGGCTIL